MTNPPRRPGRPKGARQDPAERRDALLGHAEDAIRAHGVNVSMEQIAEQADVSKATLYDNFAGKRGLTDALVDRYGVRLLRAFAERLDQPRSAKQFVDDGIEIFVDHIEADPEIYRFIVMNGAGESVFDDTAAVISSLITAVLARDHLDPSAAAPLSRATLGAVFSATEWWAANGGVERDVFVGHLTTFVWGGFRAAGVTDTVDSVDVGVVARAISDVPGTEPI